MLRTSLSSFGARGSKSLRTSLKSSPAVHSIPRRAYTPPRDSASRTTETAFTLPSHKLTTPTSNPSSILQRLRSTRFFHNSRRTRNSKAPSPNPTPNLGSPSAAAAAEAEPTTLGGRLKKLTREYGWSAFGVYMLLSALDFPFCYLLVRTLGTERIGAWEHAIVSQLKKVIPESVQNTWHEWRSSMKKSEKDVAGNNEISEHVEMAGWGVEEAEERNRDKNQASLGTQLALAYAIHKSFIFVRVPLTAAVTPKVVKILRGWGWDIGKRTTKEMKAAKRASMPVKKPKARFIGRRNK